MKKQRVFITGIAGFLGSHLADLLIESGHTVMGCDDLSGGDVENIPEAAEFVEFDLNSYEHTRKNLKNIDIVIHAAATAYDGLSCFSPHYVTQNVYSNTVATVAAAADQRVKRFVYLSSMARYGRQQTPFTEDMQPQPITPYGWAKFSAENVIKNICSIHNMEWVTCVPHNIIGPRQKYDDPYRNVAAIMMNCMLQGRQPIIYGSGEQKRCFSCIHDTLQVFEKIILSPEAAGQVFNVGPDEEFVTVNELAATIAQILDFDLDPIFVETRPEENFEANCSAQKIRQMFGYKTGFTLQSALEEMAQWMQEKGPKPFQYNLNLEIENQRLPRPWRERVF